MKKFLKNDNVFAVTMTILLFIVLAIVVLTTIFFEKIVSSIAQLLALTETNIGLGLFGFAILIGILLIVTVFLISDSLTTFTSEPKEGWKTKVYLKIRRIGYHLGMLMFVFGEVILYFTVLMIGFVFFVDYLKDIVGNKVIIIFVLSILSSMVITVIAYFAITPILARLIAIKTTLVIPSYVVERVEKTHKAFGAIFFITSLGSGLVIGVFAPKYTLSHEEQVLIFALTVFCALHYVISDIMNGFFGVSLIKKLSKMTTKKNNK
ncbi:hypothetical protein C7Y47_23460 [Lysinibacillus sphaericus]|uniref:Uncharacterized protein n=1 Tax=Lysinibacillus sphaericus TaxID=1421 RepID=A0A544U7L1_LYSSH|nr:hypothetical protein [Lysinibacillus sp. SDF0037]TQR27181.1 hypothetical protein C7Y47_23460 [Lysinibacillus sp. SDF0037]